MTLERTDFEALAHPQAGSKDAGRQRVMNRALPPAVQSLISLFLSERGDALNVSLSTALETINKTPLDIFGALEIPVTLLRHGVHGDPADAAWVAASTAVCLHNEGTPFRFLASFERARRLRLGDRHTELTKTVEVESDGTRIEARSTKGVLGWEELSHVEVDDGRIWIATPVPSDDLRVESDSAGLRTSDIVSTLRAAVDLIGEHAPEYLQWVRRAVRTIVPLAATQEVSISKSVKGDHGIVWASFPSTPLHAAEVLVHEAAHQYFNIAEHGLWMTDLLMDESTYYSPYVDAMRRVDRILFAYHAFANVLLFHRRCPPTTNPIDAACADLAEQEKKLAVLDRALAISPGLTPAGRTLYESLRRAVGPLDVSAKVAL